MNRNRLWLLGVLLGMIFFSFKGHRAEESSFDSPGNIPLGKSSVSTSNLLGIERSRPGFLPEGSRGEKPDTVRLLALRVQFQSDDDPQTTGDGTFDMTENPDVEIDPPPHDYDYFERHLRALKHYYHSVSHDKLVIVSDLFPTELDGSFTLPHVISHYTSGKTDEENDSLLAVFFRDAIQSADISDPELDFSVYDSYLIFHAGAGRESDVRHNSPKDIPSAFYNFDDLKKYLADDDPGYEGIPVKGGFVREGLWLPETESQDGFEFGLNGMAAHQFAYQLGLPSLFSTLSGRSAIGRWGLMDQGFDNEQGTVPAQPCIWSKAFLGWVKPYEVRKKAEGLDIAAWALNSGRIEAVKVPITPTEYFLIENRQRDVNEDGRIVIDGEEGVVIGVDEYDWFIPGSGLLIWHIDEEVITTTYWDNRVNANPSRRGVDLEEADGVQEIGTDYGYIYGQKNDAYFSGNSSWRKANPHLDAISLQPTSVPDSRSTSGANSHIRVTEIGESGPVMSLKVSLDTFQEGWPQFTGSPVGTNSPVCGDLDHDGDIEVVLTSENGKVFVWNDEGSKFLDNADSVFTIGPKGDTTWIQAAIFAETEDSIFSSPALGDLDGDDTLEVVITTSRGGVYAWHPRDNDEDGRADMVSGFPLSIEEGIVGSPLLADIGPNAEGIEIIVASGGTKGYIFKSNGVLYWEESVLDRFNLPENDPDLDFGKMSTTPVAVKLGSDEYAEVVWGSTTGFWVITDINKDTKNFGRGSGSGVRGMAAANLNRSGREDITSVTEDGIGLAYDFSESEEGLQYERSNWAEVEDQLNGAPALADLDGDGFLEIAISGSNRIYVFNYNGSTLPRWPVTVDRADPVGSVVSSPVIGDIDGDGDLEVVVGSPVGQLLAYHHNGGIVDGFPLACGGEVNSTPAMQDVDGDGDIEVMVASDDGYVYMWDLEGAYDAEYVPWPMHAGDAQHTGAYPSSNLPPDIPQEELLSETSVYNIPNPTEGNATLIRYRLGEEASVHIKIFNLAGELVEELIGPGLAHTENEISWDLTDIASGVYICRIEAAGASGTETAFCKIAVVK